MKEFISNLIESMERQVDYQQQNKKEIEAIPYRDSTIYDNKILLSVEQAIFILKVIKN